MTYYLPGMKVGAGAWATTHFNPELKVDVLGMSREMENLVRNANGEASTGDLVGAWIITSASIPGRIEIVREGDRYTLRQTLVIRDDRADLEEELRETASPNGRRFEKASENPLNEYYLILQDGTLQVGDDDGVFATGQPL